MNNEEMNNLLPTLVGNTAIMYTQSANACETDQADAEGRSRQACSERGLCSGVRFRGRDKLDELIAIKSREELIGDIVSLLQSPARNVISALQSAGGKIAGIVKTLSEKEEK